MPKRQSIRRDLHTSAELRRNARVRTTPARTARRMLAIANAMEGMTFTDAARAVGIERQSLGDAVKRYNAEGLAGLIDRPKSGRRRRLTPSQEAKLVEIVTAGPDPEREGFSAYTLADLVQLVEARFKVRYHPNGLSTVLHRLGLSRQKPRPFNPKRDAAAPAAFRGAR